MSAISFAVLSIPLLFANITIQSYICQPPGVPVITNPADGSAVISGNTVTVEGNATADTSVELTDNGQTYAIVTADQNNTFGTQAVFTEGSHTLGVAVTNPCGANTGGSVTITANPLPVPPTEPTPTPVPPATLPITTFLTPSASAGDNTNEETVVNEKPGALVLRNIDPPDGSTTTAASVYVSGLTNKPSLIKISVNNKVVGETMVQQTSFSIKVPLAMGVNMVTVEAISGDEHVAESLKVTRQKSDDSRIQFVWYETLTGKIIIAMIIAIILLIILLVILL